MQTATVTSSRGGDTGYGVYCACIWDLTQLEGRRTITCLPAPGIGTEDSQMSGGELGAERRGFQAQTLQLMFSCVRQLIPKGKLVAGEAL